MAKPASKELWAEAKRLFECGKSLNNINEDTGIDRASISKRAKKESWEKGKFQSLIQDTARVRAEISTLDVETRRCVENIIEDKTRSIIRYNSYQDRLAAIGMKMIEQKLDEDGNPIDINPMELTAVSRVVKDSREGVVGKAPDTAIQINNGSDQQVVTPAINAKAWLENAISKRV